MLSPMTMRPIKRVARQAAREAQIAESDPLAQLRALAGIGVSVDVHVDAEVIRARALGASWAEIAGALEISRQGAQHRWNVAMKRTSP